MREFYVEVLPGTGHSGGLVVCWKPHLQVSYCPGNGLAIYLVIEDPGQSPWIAAGIYASPQPHLRNSLWEETSDIVKIGLPTLLAGDFNTLLWPSDKKGGDGFWNTPEVQQFRKWVSQNQLQQLVHRGPKFSWCNNRQGRAWTWERLDRAFAVPLFFNQFPTAVAEVLPRYLSDHAPILVHTETPQPLGKKPFRFEKFWIEYPELSDIIRTSWRGIIAASPLGVLHHKLWRLQYALRRWNKQRIGDLPVKVREAHVQLAQTLQEEQGDISSMDWPQVRIATNRLTALQRQLETFWAQRARTKWITEGDRNSAFFHTRVQCRRARNRITVLSTADGADQAEKLIAPFTEAEIESAVRRLPSNHAPGPDGFPREFYKAFWPIIRGDVSRAIHHFHQIAQLPPSWGSTHVVLIPKNSSPSTLKDYHPISICDTKYKLIAKLLVMRLKKVLPVLVGQEQGVFVPDRSIHSHLLLVQEIMHSLRCRRSQYTLMAAKIDLQSAYDLVEWNCLTQVLQQFGFPSRWIDWIYSCVSSVRMAVLINGTPTKWFPMGDGSWTPTGRPPVTISIYVGG
ncbi:hypothetical protein QJS10_CPA10g01432 [Acorus calamus]|uniref:Reverse transcriptase domain-containing protein n=1 Tax=Acorus calamus TaxID=4465 RepID=A0AAV9E122_ACOCL|nr:hypothetical protein QJS10_CPA10g01432 [Acorus calamus]